MNKLSRSPMVAEGEEGVEIHLEDVVEEDRVKMLLNVTNVTS
jgi:hypothetical protein